MRMNPVEFDGGQPPIDGYAPGGFRIGGRFFDGALIVAPDGVRPWTHGVEPLGPEAASDLVVLRDAVDVVLVGLGPEIAPLPAAFEAALAEAGLAAEPAASAGACRTYNVLLSEGRRVAAALLPV